MDTRLVGRFDAEHVLAELAAGHDRIAAALDAVHSSPVLDFLRRNALAGRTADRWRTLRGELDLLPAVVAVLGEHLELARTLHARCHPDTEQHRELVALLWEPVPRLGPAGRAAGRDGCRLAEAVQQVEQRCADALRVLSDVDTCHSALATRLTPLVEAVDTATALDRDYGMTAGTVVLRQHLTQIQHLDLADPLTAAPAGRLTAAAEERLRDLSTEIIEVGLQLADLASLRAGHHERIGRLRARLDELEVVERSTADAYALTRREITDPVLPPLPAATAALRARATEIDALASAGRWDLLATDLAAAEQATARANRRALQFGAAAAGLLTRRDELRHMLEASRNEAASAGLADHEELTVSYDHAHVLLFTTPCDLQRSTHAVHACRQRLNTLLLHEPARAGNRVREHMES